MGLLHIAQKGALGLFFLIFVFNHNFVFYNHNLFFDFSSLLFMTKK